MSSCDSPNYKIARGDGCELSLFEEDGFSPESYVLNRLRPVEEEEEIAPWKSAVYQNLCACVKERQVLHTATNTKNRTLIVSARLLLNDESWDGQELRVLIAELKSMQQMSAKEMIKSMIKHYALFIQTSQEVTDLEEDILKLRMLLRTRAEVVRNLAAIEWTVPVAIPNDGHLGDDPVVSKLEKDAKSFPDEFDILFAERKVDLALSVLEQGEEMVDMEGGLRSGTAALLHSALLERRAKLVDYLSGICQQPSVRGVELRSAIAALNKVGEGTRAHTLLLLAHRGHLEHNVRGLRPSETSYGGAFTAALSQMTFSAIAQAERDSSTVFGAVPAYASELVVWARDVTERYAGKIKQHVLSFAAAAGGLQAAAECVQIAFGHCSLLEARGLAMNPTLLKAFRPSVEQAMEANLKRIEESAAALASADNWILTLHSQTPLFHSRRSQSRGNMKLSSSAHRFYAMAQDFMAGVSPLVSMRLAGVALEGLSSRFSKYIGMLVKAVPDTAKVQKEQSARTEMQQLALLSSATTLAHELLPVGKEPCEGTREETCNEVVDRGSTSIPGLKTWRHKLIQAVKRLRDHICEYHVKLLLYSTDKSELQLTPATYLFLDMEGRNTSSFQQLNMPSLVFQSLFFRLSSLRKAGKEMGDSSEGVVSSFLARLLEIFVSSMDQDDFWSIIEDGPSRLGPVGLKQFVLDMQFVIQMASSSECGSRTLHSLVPDLTSRAVHAFAATGADPLSVLPSDEWFLEAARIAIDELSEDWNQRSVAQELVDAVGVFQVPIAVEGSQGL